MQPARSPKSQRACRTIVHGLPSSSLRCIHSENLGFTLELVGVHPLRRYDPAFPPLVQGQGQPQGHLHRNVGLEGAVVTLHGVVAETKTKWLVEDDLFEWEVHECHHPSMQAMAFSMFCSVHTSGLMKVAGLIHTSKPLPQSTSYLVDFSQCAEG